MLTLTKQDCQDLMAAIKAHHSRAVNNGINTSEKPIYQRLARLYAMFEKETMKP